MNEKDLLRLGNDLEISAFIVANGKESLTIWFPDATVTEPSVIQPNEQEMVTILNQLDTLNVEGLNKIVLRKSQRQIEQGVSWAVYKRDHYKCRYCNADDVPLTVDHIVLWEHMGASVKENLLSACRKCNKTRGNMLYSDWLESEYYKKVSVNLQPAEKDYNIIFGEKAKLAPLRNTQRSR